MDKLSHNSSDNEIIYKSNKKSTNILKRPLSLEENKKIENIVVEIDDLSRKNVDQFEWTGAQQRLEFEQMYRQLGDENRALKSDLEYEKLQSNELILQLQKIGKELDEFKKINTIQENCIENSEAEILRLTVCLERMEQRLQENIEISEEIINDLKAKLKSTNEAIDKCIVNGVMDENVAQVKPVKELKPVARSHSRLHLSRNKPAFYIDLNEDRLLRNISSDTNNVKNIDIKVLETELNAELKQVIMTSIKQLFCQSVANNLENIPQLLTDKLDNIHGKHWNCFLSQKLIKNCVLNHMKGYYFKCEINKSIQLIVFKTAIGSTHNNINSNIIEEDTEIVPMEQMTEQTIHMLRKSNNIESQVEKFIINSTLDAIHKNFDDYQSMSSYIRDLICGKYSSQWFVSVGESKHYCTSWAMARSRKFMLFEIANIKFTIGEVAGGWLW